MPHFNFAFERAPYAVPRYIHLALETTQDWPLFWWHQHRIYGNWSVRIAPINFAKWVGRLYKCSLVISEASEADHVEGNSGSALCGSLQRYVLTPLPTYCLRLFAFHCSHTSLRPTKPTFRYRRTRLKAVGLASSWQARGIIGRNAVSV